MDTKRVVEKLIKKYNTNNPFELADYLEIAIIRSNLVDRLGFFSKYKRSKFIHLNNQLSSKLQTFVCAHELGHAILHRGINTPYLKAHTLFSVDKIEKEANTFAVELLLPDDMLREYSDINFCRIAQSAGIPSGLEWLKSF